MFICSCCPYSQYTSEDSWFSYLYFFNDRSELEVVSELESCWCIQTLPHTKYVHKGNPFRDTEWMKNFNQWYSICQFVFINPDSISVLNEKMQEWECRSMHQCQNWQNKVIFLLSLCFLFSVSKVQTSWQARNPKWHTNLGPNTSRSVLLIVNASVLSFKGRNISVVTSSTRYPFVYILACAVLL